MCFKTIPIIIVDANKMFILYYLLFTFLSKDGYTTYIAVPRTKQKRIIYRT